MFHTSNLLKITFLFVFIFHWLAIQNDRGIREVELCSATLIFEVLVSSRDQTSPLVHSNN